jgi:predicted DNA binding protein
MVEMSGSQEDLELVLDALEKEPWVKDFDLDFVESGKLVGEAVTHKCLACSWLASSRCYLMSARVSREGSFSWRLMTKDRGDLQRLVSKLRKHQIEVELLKVTPIGDREALTDRQREITMMAFERGYFDTPRKVKLKDLLSMTGVSQGTLSEILRKGQRRVLIDYLRETEKSL